jgi:uncharacterized protein (DUF362 family)
MSIVNAREEGWGKRKLKTSASVAVSHSERLAGSPTDFGKESLASVDKLTRKAIKQSCDFGSLVKGKTVLIKPNLVRSPPKGIYATTDLRVVYAVAKMALDAGAAEVIVGEKPGWKKTSRSIFGDLGLDQMLESLGARACYFDEDELVEVHPAGAKVFDKILVPKTVMDTDVLINLPKVKTHMHTIVSLGIKNLHGIVMDNQRLINHRNDLSYKLVDILRVKVPALTVSDGIWPMEGQGPLNGRNLKNFNVVVAGTDVVAVDAVTCSIMGIDPSEVDSIRIAQAEGLGCGDLEKIRVVGTKVSRVRRDFKRPCLNSSGVYPNVLSMEAGVCSGCLSCVRHSLDRLAHEGKIQGLGQVTICSGRHSFDRLDLLPPENELWLLGDCACEAPSSGLTAKAHRVPGCAPHIYDFYNCLHKQYFES